MGRRSGDRIPGGGEIFPTLPDRPRGPPSPLHNGYRVWIFPGGKTAGALSLPPTPSSVEVKERVELYLLSPYGSSWPILGWILSLPLPYDGAGAVDWKPLKLNVANNTLCEYFIRNYKEKLGRILGIKDTNGQGIGETDTPYNISILRTLQNVSLTEFWSSVQRGRVLNLRKVVSDHKSSSRYFWYQVRYVEKICTAWGLEWSL